MVGETQECQIDKGLFSWIDGIPFSKSTKNLTRDFSDAVLMAEILKFYYPRYVELHNYVSASSINTKIDNWNMLNRKVLTKLNMKLNKDMIHHLAHASQGSIEKLLLELRLKILKEGEEIHKMRIMKQSIEDLNMQISKEKIGEKSSHESVHSTGESLNTSNIDSTFDQCNSSKFKYLKQRIIIFFSWIISFFYIWNILNYCKLPRFGRHKQKILVDSTTEQAEDSNEETVSRVIYTQLIQELRDKQEIICGLNHKITCLENSMKLKDSRISNLMAQVLHNAVEMEHSVSSQSKDVTRPKLRLRSHNPHEFKTN